MTKKIDTPLRTLRKARGMRQRDLALVLGIAQQTLAHYEINEWTPPRDRKERIAQVLGVTVADLWPDDGASRRGTVTETGAPVRDDDDPQVQP